MVHRLSHGIGPGPDDDILARGGAHNDLHAAVFFVQLSSPKDTLSELSADDRSRAIDVAKLRIPSVFADGRLGLANGNVKPDCRRNKLFLTLDWL
jgi:hypothetical protein